MAADAPCLRKRCNIKTRRASRARDMIKGERRHNPDRRLRSGQSKLEI
jgi:hypothetical protein